MGTTELVTVLFTDLVGSTDALARLGEDAAEQLRQAHFSILREAIAPTSGREVKNLGDGLMVVFASASDAVACAVAMQQGLEHHNRRGGEQLSVRIGVAVGEATCEESDYFGTPVVEAARLCAKAEGGRILATDMVRMLGSRGGQRFESIGAVQLKGLPDPIPVCLVLWEPRLDAGLSLPPRLEADRVAFVGRSAEREVFEQAWKRAHTGTRQVVLVAGEPGVGKTRLATEAALAAHAGGATVLLGVCDEDLAVPYQPFVEALRHYVAVSADDELAEAARTRGGELVRLVPELRQRLPGLPPPEAADPDTERYLLFEAVAGFLAAASGPRPIVLVLDDLHWATKPTLVLLRHVVRRNSSNGAPWTTTPSRSTSFHIGRRLRSSRPISPSPTSIKSTELPAIRLTSVRHASTAQRQSSESSPTSAGRTRTRSTSLSGPPSPRANDPNTITLTGGPGSFAAPRPISSRITSRARDNARTARTAT